VERINPDLTIMHPLPRVNEISTDVDDLAGAAYFRQTRNGVFTRMALIALVMGKV
jgi:aspartate carbamoyltransferase catalytic subunit